MTKKLFKVLIFIKINTNGSIHICPNCDNTEARFYDDTLPVAKMNRKKEMMKSFAYFKFMYRMVGFHGIFYLEFECS